MPLSVDLVCVDPANIDQVWPLARGLIKAAIEKTGLSDFAEIERDILSGDQLLWLAISDHVEAAAATHLVKTPGKPMLVITACSGLQRERWLPLKSKIENYARAEGCRAVRLYGRKGWERALSDYRVEHVIMEKAI
ncbi:MAG: hypothetical protein JWP25_3625 [Bradyrhizobium sp.]|nr:hypothetical protein [Bradyrhizobium sp.]